ncbi:alpha/beta fold hydrolase [Saccharothrix coeruleofusca]|uniref:Epoxide hydrolase n=1 Tax=Saccharothrix coeruleofusca TaxID=33919 RepID=A0A918EFJ2_9PSEU|nr:alpha/beta hydrolase [Saccharothrix coeruleofusca]GGP73828.1 epoxide hydrolase [Saccharothrix coeruleofusca]
MTTVPGFTRSAIATNGTELSVLHGGRGEPLVLLHGWPQTGDCWLPVLPALAESGHTIVVPDLRGIGRSALSDRGFEKDNQVEDLRGVLRALGLGPAAHVVGHDIGGMVAFSWARLHPGEVRGLALLDLAVPGLGLERAMDVARGGRWHFGFFMAPRVAELLIDGHEDEFFALWYAQLAGDANPLSPQEVSRYAEAYRSVERLRSSFGHYRTLLDDAEVNAAWAAAGNQLTMPVLAAGGELAAGDRLATSLRSAAPHVQSAVIAGSGHFLAEERPSEVVERLLAFLRGANAYNAGHERVVPPG